MRTPRWLPCDREGAPGRQESGHRPGSCAHPPSAASTAASPSGSPAGARSSSRRSSASWRTSGRWRSWAAQASSRRRPAPATKGPQRRQDEGDPDNHDVTPVAARARSSPSAASGGVRLHQTLRQVQSTRSRRHLTDGKVDVGFTRDEGGGEDPPGGVRPARAGRPPGLRGGRARAGPGGDGLPAARRAGAAGHGRRDPRLTWDASPAQRCRLQLATREKFGGLPPPSVKTRGGR